LKAFISYSHKDREYLEKFQSHLVTLRNNGILHDWSDSELVVGDEWDREIVQSLVEADLVFFIISVDFLNSAYITDTELAITLANLDSKRVFPIIARSCDWQETPLAKFDVSRKGKPLDLAENLDAALMEIVSEIRALVKKLAKSEIEYQPELIGIETIDIQDEFRETLRSTGVVFDHPRAESIYLDDIFVYPDLRKLDDEFDRVDMSPSAKVIADPSILGSALILGEEQSGRTALAKMIFLEYLRKGFAPLLIDGSIINRTDIKRLLAPELKKQYSNLTSNTYLSSGFNRLLIIDDFQKASLNERYVNKFLTNIAHDFKRIVILGDTSLKYVESDHYNFADYRKYEILDLGHRKRSELAVKWYEIGQEETIPAAELARLEDEAKRSIDAIIKKNVIPSRPIFVLTVIQALEVTRPSDLKLSSYGHCYHVLIVKALEKARIQPDDFDTYINFLTQLAYFIFNAQETSLDEQQVTKYLEQYDLVYLAESSLDLLDTLVLSGLLRRIDQKISFGYKYIFYFYCGKYLSEHLHEKSLKPVISHLASRMHKEADANILIFTLHHTKDQTVIDTILERTSAIFPDREVASLEGNRIKFMEQYILTLPALVIEQKNVERERTQQLIESDRAELESANDSLGDSSDNAEELENSGMIAEVNRSVKAVEIIGQILRNRSGSLTRVQLRQLVESAYGSGLRFLDSFLELLSDERDELVDIISQILEKDPSIPDTVVVRQASKEFYNIALGSCFGVINKIANSVGSEKLLPVLAQVVEDAPTPANSLILIIAELEFTNRLPQSRVLKFKLDFQQNIIAQRLLKETMVRHLYLHYLKVEQKQWISETLGIPMSSQRLLESDDKQKLHTKSLK